MKKYKFKIGYDEKKIIVESLIEFRNKILKEGRYAEPINELLVMIMSK